MSLAAGSLSTLCTVERKTAGVDELGQPIPGNWEEFCKVYADIRHLNGTEAIKAGAVTSVVNASVRIHWTTALDAGMRLLVGPVVYEIKVVLPDMQRRKYVDLVCEVVQ